MRLFGKSFDKLHRELAELKSNTLTKQDLSDMANVFLAPKECKKPQGLISKIQLLNEHLMQKLQGICDELDIKFWLHGGTLLGAARHSGFIPWDDDVDLGIMRSDFEKLRQYLTIAKDCQFEIRTFHFTQTLHSVMARFVFKDKGIPVFLDLFCYDNCDYASKDNVWADYKKTREQVKAQITATNIHNNFREGIDNLEDEKILLGIFDTATAKFSKHQKDSGIIFGAEHFTSNFPRIYANDFIFPLVKIKFENGEYYAPNKYAEYLTNQYGDWERLPSDIGSAKHIYNYTNEHIKTINALVSKLGLDNRVGYTAGAFDMFHIGHLNLLKKSKESCDRLIVGITTDELIMKTKNKKPIIPLAERVEIVRGCKYVDEVVIQDDLDKVKAWEKYNYNILFSGDDWKGNPRWAEYEKALKSKGGALVVYFPYTQSVSSSKILTIIKEYEE